MEGKDAFPLHQSAFIVAKLNLEKQGDNLLSFFWKHCMENLYGEGTNTI